MTADDLRAFARRDWAAVEHSKRTFWAERYQEAGSSPARTAATALFDHAHRLGQAGTTARERDADLTSHLQVRERLDRAGRAFTSR